jgi:hypothetical protein
VVVAAMLASGCGERVEGVQPVGDDTPSEIEMERFARRLHLDLTGTVPGDAYLADAVVRLGTVGNTAAERGAMADELMATADWAELQVSELENRAFAGQTLDARYDFMCGIIRAGSAACGGCAAPGGELCATCAACPLLGELGAERDDLMTAADDLGAERATTGEIERRYADSYGFGRLIAGPDQVTNDLFEVFLGRPAEAEELRNGRAMVIGSLVPPTMAGLLFHRHGADYGDLVAILFESEIYREAAAARVFERYLGRLPTPAELSHFAAGLDPDAPDARPVVRAVVSSREYFEQ